MLIQILMNLIKPSIQAKEEIPNLYVHESFLEEIPPITVSQATCALKTLVLILSATKMERAIVITLVCKYIIVLYVILHSL